MEYQLVRTIGGESDRGGLFRGWLGGICIGPEDRLYAVGDRQVRVFDSEGAALASWATEGIGHSIAATDQGVWVGGEKRIERFDSSGGHLSPWLDEALFGLVSAIAITETEVFVADAIVRWIHRLDSSGNLLNHIGDRHRKGGFHIPNGVVDFALTRDGNVRVANPGMHRVETYRPDGEKLGFFGRFDGNDPAGFPGCCNPTNVAITPDGSVIVTEKAAPRVKIYDAAGQFLAVIADSTLFDATTKNMDIAVDSHGQIYVTDPIRRAISVFAAVEVAAEGEEA